MNKNIAHLPNPDLLHDILDAGRVRRFHTVPSHPQQTVAEHSWGATMILLYIYPGATSACIVHMLSHDIGERATGDVPAHAKWNNQGLRDALHNVEQKELGRLGFDPTGLPLSEQAAAKCADLLDLLIFCRRFNDRDAGIIAMRVEAHLIENRATLLDPFPRAKLLLEYRLRNG